MKQCYSGLWFTSSSQVYELHCSLDSPLTVTNWQRRFIDTRRYETSASLLRCIISSHLAMCVLRNHHESHVPAL